MSNAADAFLPNWHRIVAARDLDGLRDSVAPQMEKYFAG